MKNNFLLLLFLLLVNFCNAQNDVVLPRKVDILTGLIPESSTTEPSFQTPPTHPYVPLPAPPVIHSTPTPDFSSSGKSKTSQSKGDFFTEEVTKFKNQPVSLQKQSEPQNISQKVENKSKETSNDLQPLDFGKEIKKFKEEPKSFQKQSEPTTFDWKKTNAQRFVNSPCLSTLGFDPNMDTQEQERLYKECEDAKSRAKMIKNLKIGLGILLVLGFGGAIVYTFNKGQKKQIGL